MLGGVALGAIAGGPAHRIRLQPVPDVPINASDAFVNVFGLSARHVRDTADSRSSSSLPGVVSHAAYLGLNGLPVVHGQVDDNSPWPTA